MRGVSVTVKTPTRLSADDRYGNPTYKWDSQTVDDVLVAPGATEGMEASRPEGAVVSYSLHFPKTFTDSLEGCIVTLPAPWAGDYRVIGDPRAYIDADTPTRWHIPVEVEAAHG